jgi:phosphate-selective porin OprO and OprP
MKIRNLFGVMAATSLLGSASLAFAGNTVVATDGKEEVVLEKNRSPLTEFSTRSGGSPSSTKTKTTHTSRKWHSRGRYQGQVWGINSDYGSKYGWENRRQRFGGKIKFLNDFEAGVSFNLNFQGANTGRFVQDYEDFGIKWTPTDVFNIEAGLFKVPITNEWRTSSNRIITIERSNFVNMAVPGKLGGVLVTGEVPAFTEEGKFTYGAGAYTATRTEDWALPSFDGGAMFYAGIGYKFNKLHSLRFDNGFLSDNPNNNATRPYSFTSALSYSGKFLDEKFWLQSDLTMAIGQNDTPNLFGIIILPSYMLTEKIELVGRYQFLTSDEGDGVRLQNRYERRVPDLPTSFGNNYQALYAGVNYYIYKDRMKVMGGLEYSHMDLGRGNGQYNQITLVGAFRMWF